MGYHRDLTALLQPEIDPSKNDELDAILEQHMRSYNPEEGDGRDSKGNFHDAENVMRGLYGNIDADRLIPGFNRMTGAPSQGRDADLGSFIQKQLDQLRGDPSTTPSYGMPAAPITGGEHWPFDPLVKDQIEDRRVPGGQGGTFFPKDQSRVPQRR